ncbi:hypothetical protein ACFYUY_11275 [Kitasatospora sp. NPDC004745]|uniref:hypothetical protein n=1 Tax=unclassified Kitasatospora TaxID=2633591 RepID=UPI0036C5B15A
MSAPAPRPGRRTLLTGLAAAAAAGAVPPLLAGCSTAAGHKAGEAAAARASDAGGAAFVMIVRHGEKPDGDHPGLDENGAHDGKSLTERGWARAKALPTLFDPPAPGLRTPARILAAADRGPLAGAHRMRQTVTPLAARLGLTVDTTHAESQETALATAALAGAQPVLISWEHSRIPRIIEALGATTSGAPTTWPDRFDLIWTLTRPTTGPWTFHQLPQHLLPGDT